MFPYVSQPFCRASKPWYRRVLRHERRHQAAEAQMRQDAAASPQPIARGTRVGGMNDLEDVTCVGHFCRIFKEPKWGFKMIQDDLR